MVATVGPSMSFPSFVGEHVRRAAPLGRRGAYSQSGGLAAGRSVETEVL